MRVVFAFPLQMSWVNFRCPILNPIGMKSTKFFTSPHAVFQTEIIGEIDLIFFVASRFFCNISLWLMCMCGCWFQLGWCFIFNCFWNTHERRRICIFQNCFIHSLFFCARIVVSIYLPHFAQMYSCMNHEISRWVRYNFASFRRWSVLSLALSSPTTVQNVDSLCK